MNEELQKIEELKAKFIQYQNEVTPMLESPHFSLDWVKKNILQINDHEG
jgi:hypothetical protein